VDGVVQANDPLTGVPFTEATPPDSVEDASVCPTVIALAVGNVEIVGVAGFTVTVTEPVTLV